MIEKTYLDVLETDGLVVVPQVIHGDLIDKLRMELVSAIKEDAILRSDVFDKGMVHNCMVRGNHMAALLDDPKMNAYLSASFSDTAIIYAYQSSSLPPKKGNYGSRVHVDSPRFIEGYSTNMGVMFALNDFTLENGATYYLPGSHRLEHLPDEDYFYEGAQRAICKAGDMIILNPRLMHAAGVNQTDVTRHALTINFCRSYMRQRFDFARLVAPEIIASLGEKGRQLIGMNVRVPTSLDEFYLPAEQRLYKPNQG